jgi:signal transduction histidine kinase
MSNPSVRWHRSLYWRIGLGLIAFLALMLAAQAALFVWTTDRIAGSMPARNPARLAALVASDLSSALTADPAVDLAQYVRDHYGNVYQMFVVVMQDGVTISNHDDVPGPMAAEVRAEFERRVRMIERVERRLDGRGADATQGRGRGRGGIGPARIRLLRSDLPRANLAPVFARDAMVGLVAVAPGPPRIARIARELGPTLAILGGGVLAVGASLIAFVVFGPVRRRLRLVQRATERLGRGELDTRIPDTGGDEVAALAQAFNRMAGDLQTRAAALSASDQARRQLLADVSHELMTPLTAMRGYLETLAMAELRLDPPTRERYLRIVDEETRRLERIIGDLLDLARLEGGGSQLRREYVDTTALFERVAERHDRELSERRVTLEQRIDPAAARLIGDPDRLEQALQNLAANALRHTPDGGAVTLSAARDGAVVTITVRDTGPGIPREHLPLIFDRFYKADAARATAGSGLGLSIVKAIVERHGGTISVRNDRGAVFEIRLPASQ